MITEIHDAIALIVNKERRTATVFARAFSLPHSMHIHRPQKKRVWIKYYIGGHIALVDVDVRCRAPISNEEASGWASHAEGGGVGQAPVAYI